MAQVHPVARRIAIGVYWLLFGPWVLIALPFAIFSAVIGWLYETAFPAIIAPFQPLFGLAERFARRTAGAVGWAVHAALTPNTPQEP